MLNRISIISIIIHNHNKYKKIHLPFKISELILLTMWLPAVATVGSLGVAIATDAEDFVTDRATVVSPPAVKQSILVGESFVMAVFCADGDEVVAVVVTIEPLFVVLTMMMLAA